MLPRYRIPEIYLPGFKALGNLSSESSEKIAEVLESVSLDANSAEFRERIKEVIDNKNSEVVAEAIYSLGALLGFEGIEISVLPEILNNSLESQDKSFTGEQAKKFKENLSTILTKSQKLKYRFKAYNLLAENFYSYDSSRIITDFRPVFDDHKIEAHLGVILHQLKINYITANQNEEFFVSMNRNELTLLQEQIRRALEKEEYIKGSFKDFQFIDIKD